MTVSPGTDVAVTELLAALAGLPGLLRACVFEVGTGTVHMTVGSDVEPPASLLARARQAHAGSDGGTGVDDDVIVTSSGAHHLLREVPAAAGDVLRTAVLWVYVELDGERADLPLARRRLAHATRHGGAPAPPSLTFASPDPPPPPPAATPALAMLPPLDESWGPIGAAARAAKTRRAASVAAPVIPTPVTPTRAVPLPRVATVPPPPAPTVPAPTVPAPASPSPIPSPSPPPSAPTPMAPPVGLAPDDRPSAPLPRRVPVTGRPLALVEPPTVPPPPPPGPPRDPDDATTETAVPAPDEPDEPDGDAPTTEVPATTTRPMPAHRQVPTARSLPAPRSPERPGGWDADVGTLRRLVVTLRRLA